MASENCSSKWWLGLTACVAVMQAVVVWQVVARPAAVPPVPSGTLVAVTLTNGAIFYGRTEATASGHLRLGDVYYVESVAGPNGQRDNRLVNRQRNDWHAPDWMAIPAERIQSVEAIGAGSRLATLMAEDKKATPR